MQVAVCGARLAFRRPFVYCSLRLHSPRTANLQVLAQQAQHCGIVQGAKRRTIACAAMKHDFIPIKTVEKQIDTSEALRLRIISYNILAQCYIKSEIFPYAPKNCLKWKHRSRLLEQELLSFDADFICLQELDMFADFFQPLMEQNGYSCLYRQRPNRKNDGCGIFFRKDRFELLEWRDVDFNDLVPDEDSPSEEPPLKLPRTGDGTAGFSEAARVDNSRNSRPSVSHFEASVGTSVASQIIENDSAEKNGAPMGSESIPGASVLGLIHTGSKPQSDVASGSVPTEPRVKKPTLGGLADRLMQGETGRPVRDFATAARFSKEHRLQRDCVAVFGAFRPVGVSRGAIVVATTHIYWDPQWIDVKLAQAEYLLYSLSNFLESLSEGARGDVPVMLCGDFNSQPGDRVYRYLTSAPLPDDQQTVEGKARKVDIESAANKLFVSGAPLKLFSAHERAGGEPPFTNYTPKFTGTLDYCFVTDNMVPRLVAKKTVPDKTEQDLGVGIPNGLYPSDHLPVGFDFEFNRQNFT